MFKECDKTLSCILFKISFSFLTPSCDLTFLAVLTETAPRTFYNDITLGQLFITWILPLEFKEKCRILTARFMVFSDSFSSLFLIQEPLISSGVIILYSLLIILSSLHLFCLLCLKCSRHKLAHANTLQRAGFRILVLVRQEKTMEGWMSIRPSFFQQLEEKDL